MDQHITMCEDVNMRCSNLPCTATLQAISSRHNKKIYEGNDWKGFHFFLLQTNICCKRKQKRVVLQKKRQDTRCGVFLVPARVWDTVSKVPLSAAHLLLFPFGFPRAFDGVWNVAIGTTGCNVPSYPEPTDCVCGFSGPQLLGDAPASWKW